MKNNGSPINTDHLPRFISLKYDYLQKCISCSDEDTYAAAVNVFERILRFIAIYLTCQYLRRDPESVKKRNVNELLDPKQKHGHLETVFDIIKTTFQAYEGNARAFFIREMYYLYWDASDPNQHIPREDLLHDIKKMIDYSNDIIHKKGAPQKNKNEWSSQAAECVEIVDRLLNRLSFLERYEILRIDEKEKTSNQYTAELHQGIDIKLVKFNYSGSLHKGWIYITDQNRANFLRLDPLIHNTGPKAMAIYRELTDYFKLQYLLLTGDEIVEQDNDSVIEEFFNLLVTIENVKKVLPIEEEVDWPELQALARKHNENTAKAIRKVDKSLYLQRDSIYKMFVDFLENKETPCFVLTGKSGSGKSSFVLSMFQDIDVIKNNYNICPLVFSAPLFSEGLTASITASMYDSWEQNSEKPSKDIWTLIEPLVKNRPHRTILVVIDAVNEYKDPDQLFKEIFELLRKNKPWLKIVITSRPEALELLSSSISTDLITDEWFYKPAYTEDVGLRQTIPLAACEVLPFTPQELPLVYQKYQDHYKLKTDYKEIKSQAILDLLRDPFYLWIMAEGHRNEALPLFSTRFSLVNGFIKGLRGGGKAQSIKAGHLLDDNDIKDLEDQFVPLFFPSKNVLDLRPSIDPLLHLPDIGDRVTNTGRYSNGKFVNPILRLSEAKIIRWEKNGRSTYISFQHDKFHEYFVGNYLFKKMQEKDWFDGKITMGYRELIDSPLMDKAVLSGIIQNALYCHLQQTTHGQPLLVDFPLLCVNPNPMVKLVVVPVLTAFYFENTDNHPIVENILTALSQTPFPSNANQNWDALNATLTAHEVALETACEIEKLDMLVDALLNPQAEVRELGIRYTYLLDRTEAQKWSEAGQQDEQYAHLLSFQVLAQVGDEIGSSFLRYRKCFGSFAQISMNLLFEHMDEEFDEGRERVLIPIILGTIRKIGHFGAKKHSYLDQGFQFILMVLMLQFITMLLKVMAKFPRRKVAAWDQFERKNATAGFATDGSQKNTLNRRPSNIAKADQQNEDVLSSSANYKVFSLFYKNVKVEERETARKLSQYMDLTNKSPLNDKDFDEVEALLIEGFKNPNCMTTTLGNAIASSWATKRPDRIMSLCEKIYQVSPKSWEVALDASIVWYQAIKRQKYVPEQEEQWDTWLREGKDLIRNIIDCDPNGYGRFIVEGDTYEQYPLLFYIAIFNRIHPNSPNDLLCEYIDRAMTLPEKQKERLMVYLADTLGDRRAYLVNHSPVLRSFEPYIPKEKEKHTVISDRFEAHLAATFAGIRGVFAQQIDNFLASVNADKHFVNQVVRMSYDRHSTVISLRAADFVYDLLIHADPRMGNVLVQVAQLLTYARSFDDALRKIGFYIVERLNETE